MPMSLTYEDLQAIRAIVEETVDPLKGELEALSNDIKDIYEMLAEIQKSTASENLSEKQGLEEKILSMHASLVEAAKQAGVVLPSH